MRDLFLSERRCVFNLFQTKWSDHELPASTVVSETVAVSRRVEARSFNSDFILHFVDWRKESSARLVAVASVLPNALGAELFLVVQKESLTPTALELNGGSAFPISYYSLYIECIESAIRKVITPHIVQSLGIPRKVLDDDIRVKNAAFARILVVGLDATFLYCPNDKVPLMRGNSISFESNEGCSIAGYFDHSGIICIDGWITVNPAQSERKLVAIPGTARTE